MALVVVVFVRYNPYSCDSVVSTKIHIVVYTLYLVLYFYSVQYLINVLKLSFFRSRHLIAI